MKNFLFSSLILLTLHCAFGQALHSTKAQTVCPTCDVAKVNELESHLPHLTLPVVEAFLCTFDSSCRQNTEFSEVGNTALFRLIDKNPSLYLNALKNLSRPNQEAVLALLNQPLLDFNLNQLYRKVKAAPGPAQTKEKTLAALKAGMKRKG